MYKSILLLALIFVTSSSAQFNCSVVALTSFADVCICNGASLTIACQESNFTSIPTGFPAGLDHLSVVESREAIEVLDVIPYSELTQLHLNNIGLRYIRARSFARLAKLETLMLLGNRITSISSETFSGLKSLQTLSLEGNKLYEITEYTFIGAMMPSVRLITLASCHIYKIETHAFYELRNLYEVNVGYNHLSELPDLNDVTCALTNLTKLDMTDNQLRFLDTASSSIPSSLQELWLSDNQIEAVTYEGTGNVTASKVSMLRQLRLRRNHVSKFDGKALSGFPGLEEIDLVDNRLTSLDGTEWPWKTLNKVLLYDNPWECSGCVNAWMSTKDPVKEWNNGNTSHLVCSTPSQYKGKNVYDVIDSSTCAVKSHAELVVVIVLFLLFVTLVLALLFVVVRRRRMKRKMAAINKNTTNGASTSMSYRQMRDMSPFSINDDDDERS